MFSDGDRTRSISPRSNNDIFLPKVNISRTSSTPSLTGIPNTMSDARSKRTNIHQSAPPPLLPSSSYQQSSLHFQNPFANPHPFTLSNLSESAICTTDDEDNYSFASANSTSNQFTLNPNTPSDFIQNNSSIYPTVPGYMESSKKVDFNDNFNKVHQVEDGSDIDNDGDDDNNHNDIDDDSISSSIFQSRPLTDTPVFSAEDLENLDDIEDLDLSSDKEDEKKNDDKTNHEDEIFGLEMHKQQQPKKNHIISPNIHNLHSTDHYKKQFKKLIPSPMQRIESQETAVITTTANPGSHNNSGSNIVKSSSIFNIPGQTISTNNNEMNSDNGGDKLIVIMIGLPARGKSYLSNKMVRYLNWLQINSKIFNVGSTRRMKSKNTGTNIGPCDNPLPDAKNENYTAQDASFFSPGNQKSIALREEWARETLDSLLDYLLLSDGCVGVFDATNTTVKRRKMVLERIMERNNGKLKILFLESICSDEKLIEKNVLLKLKGPDYKNMDSKIAKKDFLNRLSNYEKVYETISKEEENNPNFQYIQMIDVGRKIISCNINGYIASQIVYYFLNFNLNERLIFVSRHGESIDNLKGKIGGDSNLTERGKKYSIALEKFVREKQKEFKQNMKFDNDDFDSNATDHKVTVISSMLKRSVQTAEAFNDSNNYDLKQLRLLNELGSGKFDGMTYQEIAQKYPEEFENRIKNKLTYRYPGLGGESYLDVISRLKPVINEIERSKSHLMIISHRVVCRILMAYFLNLQKDSIGDLDIPLHSVYMFHPKPFGVLWHLFQYDENTNSFIELDLNKNNDNLKTIKQVGISFRERKYSVVPTAPFGEISRKSSFRNSFKSTDLSNVRNSLRLPNRGKNINDQHTSVRSEYNNRVFVKR